MTLIMRQDKLSQMIKERKEGVFKLGKKYVVRIKKGYRITSIKSYDNEIEANKLYNDIINNIPNPDFNILN